MLFHQLSLASASALALLSFGSAAPTPFPVVARQSSLQVSAWWGQTANTVDLNTLCSSDSIDIVMLSFLNHFWADGLWPGLNFGAYTAGPSDAQKSAGANSLTDGSNLVSAIQKCQSSGKKVYLSLGGDSKLSSSAFANDDEASAFAHNLWNLFLGGVGNSTTDPIRPFGSVILDGIDLDNENGGSASYPAMISQLRSDFAADSSHSYGISAVPQCNGHSTAGSDGDSSLPDSLLQTLDHVFVQFYNNPSCLHGTSGFAPSVQAWSAAIGNAKLWIGTPVNQEAAGIGSLPIDQVAAEVQSVLAMNLPNLGGYAVWDGSIAVTTKDANGDSYDKVTKNALTSGGSAAPTPRISLTHAPPGSQLGQQEAAEAVAEAVAAVVPGQ